MSIAIVPVVVPPFGEGPIADISALVGPKTVTLTGRFVGAYTLLASHNNSNFVPVLLFDSDGVEQIRQTLPDAFTSVRLRSNAGTLGAGVTATVAGISIPADNLFATLATFTPGSSGTSAIIDTSVLFPPSGLEKDINIICEGGFRGDLVVEGSNDGSLFNPIGQFSAGGQQRPLLGIPSDLEFAPLSVEANTRYLRFTLSGQVFSPVTLTIGGTIPISEASGAGISIDEDRGGQALNFGPTPGTEVILYEWEKTFTGLAGVITAILTGIWRVLPASVLANGVFRVYIGATTPGDTTGGTVCITANTSVNVETGFTVSGAPFANPGGTQLIQITGEVTAPGVNPGDLSQADIRGIGLNIG